MTRKSTTKEKGNTKIAKAKQSRKVTRKVKLIKVIPPALPEEPVPEIPLELDVDPVDFLGPVDPIQQTGWVAWLKSLW